MKRTCAFTIEDDLYHLLKLKSKNMSKDVETLISYFVNSDGVLDVTDEEFKELEKNLAQKENDFEVISSKYNFLKNEIARLSSEIVLIKAKNQRKIIDKKIDEEKRTMAGLNSVHVLNKMGMNDIMNPDNFVPSDRPFVERKNEFEREE